eukprot:SAG11_NODE_12132_length_720_cov_1.320451_1_plen_58_part_10
MNANERRQAAIEDCSAQLWHMVLQQLRADHCTQVQSALPEHNYNYSRAGCQYKTQKEA